MEKGHRFMYKQVKRSITKQSNKREREIERDSNDGAISSVIADPMVKGYKCFGRKN